ncbi:hypothetical protein ACFSX9_07490 [Flavobacterium ardleyense]|uniref:Uncharacterized protein n=1 Tax=Flavobacterium ardleyense TaxID=2038737 RepID=A0ABW5Z7E4_9FLAO
MDFSLFIIPAIVLSLGFALMFYMMNKNKKHVTSQDLATERLSSAVYQKEYLDSEYNYIKDWMRNAPIDAFTSATIPYTGMDKAKDVGKDLLKSALTLGTVKFRTVETPSFVVLSEGKMHYFSTTVEGDLKEHLIFNADRLSNAIVTSEVEKNNSEGATSKSTEILAKKYIFTFNIDGQSTAIEVHDRIAFNSDVTSMFGNNYSLMLTKNQVVGETFYNKIIEIYPNLIVKK